MRLEFDEHFDLPPEDVYSYFRTPADWVRLYGFAGPVEEREGGWWAVPLRHFPFPLVARITMDRPGERVEWVFGGVWRGAGGIHFTATKDGVRVEGYETIGLRWLPGISRLLEKAFMEERFRAVWARGWRRLRRAEEARGRGA